MAIKTSGNKHRHVNMAGELTVSYYIKKANAAAAASV